jgi:hypothetical protein
MVAPEVIHAGMTNPLVRAAARSAADVTKDAAVGGWEGGMAPTEMGIKIKGIPVSVGSLDNVPAAVTGAVTGSGVGAAVGAPFGAAHVTAPLGTVVGGALPVVKGAIKGVREGIANRAAVANAAADAAAAPAPLPVSRQIAAPSAIPMPAVADTSGPIPTDPATGYPLRPGQTAGPVIPTAPVAPPIDPLLEQIARGNFNQSYASMDAAAQDTVQKMAASVNRQATRPVPPPVAPPPAPIAQPVNAAAVPAQPPPVATQAPPVAPAAAPSVNAAAPQAAAPGEVQTIPQAKPDVPAEVFKTAARDVKSTALAKILHDSEIPLSDAARMTPDHWAQLAKAAGVNVPSPATIADTMLKLRQLEAKTPSPALAEALKKPGAMKAAQAMADAMRP